MNGELFSVGSGSPFAYGVVDNGMDFDLDVPSAIELAKRAIYHATNRDGASGGSVNSMYLIELSITNIECCDLTQIWMYIL